MRFHLPGLLCAAIVSTLAPAAPITYQGVLRDGGSPATGMYNLSFYAYTHPELGGPLDFVSQASASNVSVADGLFMVELEFAPDVFDGSPLFLEIDVSPSAGGAAVTLLPRQPLGDTANARHANVADVANVATNAIVATTANSLALPYTDAGAPFAPTGGAFFITNTTASGYGIGASGPLAGFVGFSGDFAGYPPFRLGTGTAGVGEVAGVMGSCGSGAGVVGITGSGYGGEFTVSGSNSGTALWAHTAGGGGAGLFEIDSTSNNTPALLARTASTSSSSFAIHGIVEPTSAGSSSAAVRGENRSTSGLGIGVVGSQAGSGWGVYGFTPTGRGVFGAASASGGVGVYGSGSGGAAAGYFSGSVTVTGTLSKGGGAFKIDHPLDPANKYLSHSFVESPDMKNIYDGVATLDAAGRAEVTLPDWFDALNRDFRYQLTCVGGYAPVFIDREISANSFVIAGGTPGLRVSWQVTGTRQDAYANAHRIPLEEDKPASERGRYLHPDAFGLPADRGIGHHHQAQ